MKKTTMTMALLLAVAFRPAAAADTQQERFPTPDAAAKALATAARANDTARLAAVLGADSEAVVSSGDPVDDARARKQYATWAAERTQVEQTPEGDHAIVHVGKEDWPLPIPLVHEGNAWRFDTAAGKEELLNRRIGRNELSTISTCRTYVEAQHEYAARFHEYAQVLRSTPGKHDGLYWEASGKEESPLGPLVAEATAEGYAVTDSAKPAPYHGYYFRPLKAQGAHAPGGARDWVKDGKMTGGFGLLAWPAEHGASGVMTFIVGPQGVVFQKDLGAQTEEAAKAITTYDPDGSWNPTR